MKTAFATIVTALLLGILATQMMILRSMSSIQDSMPAPLPTFGDIRKAKTQSERTATLLRQPLVRVSGSVDAEITSMP
jgi:hypothetical protein